MRNWALYFLILLITGCNRGELVKLEDQMNENAETVERIREMRVQLLTDFQNIRILYEALEKKLYVAAITKQTDGTYILSYSDGSEIKLRNGVTPVISFGADREVIINGIGTGYHPTDGTDGYLPQVTIDSEGFYVVDGIKTNVKGIKGESGQALTISIDAENYYCVNGVRVIPEINLKSQHGSDGSAPVPTVEWNIAAGKYELKINGQPTAPPTFVSPENGGQGAAGNNAPWIKQVTMNENNELVFTFTDNTTQKSIPVMLSDLLFTLSAENLTDLPLDRSVSLNYTLKTKYTTNPATVEIYQSLPGWKARVGTVNANSGTGEIILIPISGGLTAGGAFFFAATDSQGAIIVRRIEVSPRTYSFAIPTFDRSDVYSVLTENGTKIAEVCKEPGWTAVYPYDPQTETYGPGFIPANGGTVNHNGLNYIAGTADPATQVLLSAGQIASGREGSKQAIVTPEFLTDVEDNKYPITKNKSVYKTTGYLQTTQYRDGSRIVKSSTFSPDYGTYYKDGAGKYFYSANAMASGKLTPAGWHIETMVNSPQYGNVICVKDLY